MLEIKLERTNHVQINIMIDKFENEKRSAFRKVHRMIDLFEVIIKTHTTAVLASCFSLNNVSDDMKSLLAWGLRTPSLGLWCVFAREGILDLIIRKTLSEDEYQWAIGKLYQKGTTNIFEKVYTNKDGLYHIDYEEVSNIKGGKRKLAETYKKLGNFQLSPSVIDEDFYNYFFEWDSYMKDGRKYPKKDVVSFRNSYAHGGTPSEEECLLDIETYQPLLKRMLNEKWLHNTSLEIEEIPTKGLKRVYLTSKDYGRLDLFPLLQYINHPNDLEKNGYYFLNDLKNFNEYKDEICLLNYPDAILLKEYGHKDAFLNVININEWKKHRLQNEFAQRIAELSQTFKGRNLEKDKIYKFIDNNNEGFFMLSGSPGIGKSAIFAKLIEEFKIEVSSKEKDMYIIEYFIRRNTQGSLVKSFLEYFHKKLDKIYNTNIPYTGDIENDRRSLFEKLILISKSTSKKIVIFIDGIDEGITQENENILMYLITENIPNTLVLYSGRWRADIEKFYFRLPIEHKSILILEGLKKDDIRGMLYEVTSKYELDKDSLYIEEISKRSEGNPLYVRLLCKDIEDGNKIINSLEELPKNLKVFYDEILLRLAEEPNGDILLKSLYILAVAKEYISPMFIELCLELDAAEVHQVFIHLKEVLIEDSKKNNMYQIFHESLRDYLIDTKKEEVDRAHYEIVKFCSNWESHYESHYLSEEIRNYSAKHYSKHLLAIGMYNEMENLVLGKKHQDYLKYQIDSTNQFDLSFQTYYDACRLFRLVGKSESLIGTAIKAYQLHSKKDELYNDIFLWIRKGDLESLIKAGERIKSYNGGKKKNLYLLLLYYGINSSMLNNEEKYKFILEYLDRGEEYLEIVKNDLELPNYIIGEIIEYCISYDIDFSKLLNVKYDYCKIDCEQYGSFYEYILDIHKYFINRNNVQACIETIHSIKDIAIASNCCANLLEDIYKKSQIWNRNLIKTMLELAKKHDINSIFPYPFESIFKALSDKNEHNTIDNLIQDYLNPERSNSCSDFNKLNFGTTEIVIALYKVNLNALGDKVFEKYLYPFLKDYDGNSRASTYMQHFTYNLYRLKAFKTGNQLIEGLGDKIDKYHVFSQIIAFLLNNKDIKSILSMVQHYKDREDVLKIIIDSIKKENQDRILELLKDIPLDSIIYEPLKDKIKESASKIERKTIKQTVDDVLVLIKSHNFEPAYMDNIINKTFAKRPYFIKYNAYTEIVIALIEQGRIEQALYMYLHQMDYLQNDKVVECCEEYWQKGNKGELLDVFYNLIEKHWESDEEQVLIRLLIQICINKGETELAFSWYNKLEKGVYKDIIIYLCAGLDESGKKELSNQIIEDLFYTGDGRILMTKEYVEECKDMLTEKAKLDEEIYIKETDNFLYEEEVIRKENEKTGSYLTRLARNKYYTSSKEEFFYWINNINEDVYIELILDELTPTLTEDDEIELLIKLNNMLTKDIYYKTQSIAYLAVEMPKLKDIDKVEKWIETANNYIDTYYMKKEFFEWVITTIYDYKDKMLPVLEILLPYLFKDEQLLENVFLKYVGYLVCQDNKLSEEDKLFQSIQEIISLDDVLMDTKIEYCLENINQWIELIHDIEDQEEILKLEEEYKSGKISEDRMKKKLNRILLEYELS